MNFIRKSEDNDENKVLLSDGLSNLLNKKHKLFVQTHQVYLEQVVVSDHRKERNVQKANERTKECRKDVQKSVERMYERL